MEHLSCTGNDCWLLCFFLLVVFPLLLLSCCCCCCCCYWYGFSYHIISYFFSFSYPYTPHSFRSWIGSIHREARLGYGYRKDRVFRDENGYHVCEACAPSICAFDVCCYGETNGMDLLVLVTAGSKTSAATTLWSHRVSWSIENCLYTGRCFVS